MREGLVHRSDIILEGGVIGQQLFTHTCPLGTLAGENKN